MSPSDKLWATWGDSSSTAMVTTLLTTAEDTSVGDVGGGVGRVEAGPGSGDPEGIGEGEHRPEAGEAGEQRARRHNGGIARQVTASCGCVCNCHAARSWPSAGLLGPRSL